MTPTNTKLRCGFGGIILKPQPPHRRQTYEQTMAPELSSWPCFEAFGVIFCSDVCSYFALYVWKMLSSNLFEGLIFLLACSVRFVRRRFWAISRESQRSCPNRRRTKCTEHAKQKIRTSKRLELYIFQSLFWAIRFGFRGPARPYLRFLPCNSDFRAEIRIILLNLSPESFLRGSTVKGS